MSKKIHPTQSPFVVRGAGGIIAETKKAVILSEDGQADRIFFPKEDVAMVLFDPSKTTGKDPVLGAAKYFHLAGKSKQVEDVAWSYDAPSGDLSAIASFVTFDNNKVTVEEL